MPEAHAPGKLVLCGEYAVLHGAPAIAIAVDVRARARVVHADGPGSLRVEGHGHAAFDWRRDGEIVWLQTPGPAQGQVLGAVAAALAASGAAPAAVPPMQITLDTRAFQARLPDGTSEKLGLGSSAAVTVALAAAILACFGQPVPEPGQLTELCRDAHRRLQGGRGSGVDVAAAVHGGIISLSTVTSGIRVRQLGWPEGLSWTAVWSGHGASTPAMLARFEAFRQADASRFARHIKELGNLAQDVTDAWERGEVPTILRALADYDDALRALDDGARLGIYTPVHDRLARMAEAVGAVYKISGAGGGDFGVAFAASAGITDSLRRDWAAQGLLVLPPDTGAPGVMVAPGSH